MKILADTGTVFETGTTNPLAITYLDDTHFVIAYRDVTDGNKGKVVCGVIDELTPTLGAIVEFSSVAVWTEISISRLDDTHFVIAYEIAAPASGICKVGSVSGTTITMGGAKTFAAGAVSYYDVCGMDATHFVVAFTLDSPYTGRAIAGSVSGTTITMGVVDVFASTDRSALYTSICSLDSSHFVIAYRGSLSGGSVVVCGTLSGNTVTVTEDGGSSFATSNSAYKTSVCAIDDTHFVITYSEYPGYAGKVIAGSVSGTTITIVEDGASTFESGYTQTPSVARVSATGFVISFVDVTDSSKGKVIIGEPEGTSAGGGAHIAQTGDAHLKKASTFWASAHDAEEADSVEGGSTILVGAVQREWRQPIRDLPAGPRLRPGAPHTRRSDHRGRAEAVGHRGSD